MYYSEGIFVLYKKVLRYLSVLRSLGGEVGDAPLTTIAVALVERSAVVETDVEIRRYVADVHEP